MKVKVLQPLNYKGKTVEKEKVIELEDDVTKVLIEKQAVVKVGEMVEQKLIDKKAEIKTGEQK